MTINPRNSPLFAQGLQKWNTFVATYEGPYDFSESVYAGMNRKVWFKCPAHGEVCSDAKNLLNGRQCQQCMFAARKGKRRLTRKQVLARFAAAHGATYDYSEVTYGGQQTPVRILCARHGAFYQKPEYHWGGAGCPACFHEDRRGASRRLTQEQFEQRVAAVLEGKISVASVQHVNTQADIYVTCTEHGGELKTRAGWLLNGQNPCPRCNHMKSKGEEAVFRFLSALTPAESRNRVVLKPKELDIYLPEHNLAVEYSGMFWHSVGDAVEERKKRGGHYDKYQAADAQGVRVITLFESEWQERAPQVRRTLRAAIGKLRGKVPARKCALRQVETPEARAFFDRYHIQGGAGGGVHYGLYWKGKLVACMRFTLGGNDRGAAAQDRTWTLSRYATRVGVVGGASRLFTAFLREYSPEAVKSFSDNRWFSGAMYEALGFTLDAELEPDYQVWSMKLGLRPKAHYQRRHIPARLRDHGADDEFDPMTDPRTETEMTYLMGARRIYDCGKKRWIWHPS